MDADRKMVIDEYVMSTLTKGVQSFLGAAALPFQVTCS